MLSMELCICSLLWSFPVQQTTFYRIIGNSVFYWVRLKLDRWRMWRTHTTHAYSRQERVSSVAVADPADNLENINSKEAGRKAQGIQGLREDCRQVERACPSIIINSMRVVCNSCEHHVSLALSLSRNAKQTSLTVTMIDGLPGAVAR